MRFLSGAGALLAINSGRQKGVERGIAHFAEDHSAVRSIAGNAALTRIAQLLSSCLRWLTFQRWQVKGISRNGRLREKHFRFSKH